MSNWIVLDRDGVINADSDQFVKSAAEWRPLAGSIEAIAALSKAGFKLVVASNQSGLARKLFTQADLDAMHSKMQGLIAAQGGKLEGIFYCPHGPDDDCNCRKPKAGLLDQIEKEFSVSLNDSWLVGDSLRDLQCAGRKGCKPVLVKTGKGLKTLSQIQYHPELNGLTVFDDLSAFAAELLP